MSREAEYEGKQSLRRAMIYLTGDYSANRLYRPIGKLVGLLPDGYWWLVSVMSNDSTKYFLNKLGGVDVGERDSRDTAYRCQRVNALKLYSIDDIFYTLWKAPVKCLAETPLGSV